MAEEEPQRHIPPPDPSRTLKDILKENARLLEENERLHRMLGMPAESSVLEGSLKKKERTGMFEAIRKTPFEEDLLVIATGNYIGEGFDCPQIDTLLLAFPIAFRGRVVQYAGRLMRNWKGKIFALVYDYADNMVPVLKKMHGKRLKAYRDLGFSLEEPGPEPLWSV